jgi:hypothetical protein
MTVENESSFSTLMITLAQAKQKESFGQSDYFLIRLAPSACQTLIIPNLIGAEEVKKNG